MTGGRPDVNKIKPFAFNPRPEADYQAFGEPVGKAFSMGLDLKK
jgi:hypothetical protein